MQPLGFGFDASSLYDQMFRNKRISAGGVEAASRWSSSLRFTQRS